MARIHKWIDPGGVERRLWKAIMFFICRGCQLFITFDISLWCLLVLIINGEAARSCWGQSWSYNITCIRRGERKAKILRQGKSAWVQNTAKEFLGISLFIIISESFRLCFHSPLTCTILSTPSARIFHFRILHCTLGARSYRYRTLITHTSPTFLLRRNIGVRALLTIHCADALRPKYGWADGKPCFPHSTFVCTGLFIEGKYIEIGTSKGWTASGNSNS